MKRSDDPGIDYSGIGGTCNRDRETGIRYGIISQESVSCYTIEDILSNGDDLGFAHMKQEAKDAVARAIASAIDDYGQIGDPDELAHEIIENSVEWHDCDESGPYAFEEGDLKVQTTSDNNLWVFKSPFYTRAQFCSPCVPGAGNLDTFCPDGPKTYCLPADWFEDGKAPYDIWCAKTDDILYECE